MSEGIVCTIEWNGGGRPAWERMTDCAWALLAYVALWGGLCSMAYLSTSGAASLALGGLLAAALALSPRGGRPGVAVVAAGALLAAVLFLARRQMALDGVKLLLNRLFAASEARQAYTYEMFSVGAEEGNWQDCIRWGLAPLGIAAGLLCGGAARDRSGLLWAALFALCAGLAAWLGLSAGTVWNILLALTLALSLADRTEKPIGAALLSACAAAIWVALLCVAVLTAAPGEDARLSAWDEGARDVLAIQTVAWSDQWSAQPQSEARTAQEDRRFYRAEETAGELGGDAGEWLRPISAALVILLFALALFLPAILSDRWKKRRAAHRAGLDDPDNSASIRAMFRCALRWLCAGGLEAGNIPFSGYAGGIETAYSPALRAAFEEVLPLWQESAYSDHPMDEGQRARMRAFLEAARGAVWEGLDRKGRFWVQYIRAL